LNLNKVSPLLALSILPLLVTLLLLHGDLPDPDRNAHDMWAEQLINTGRLVISEHGIFNNWQLFYPNTVPKPLELLTGIIRAVGGVFFHSAIVLATSLLVLLAAWYSAGGGRTGIEAAFYLGFNPVFVFLCILSSPAVPFIGAMFLLQSTRGAGSGAILASLSRPEGFIYSIYHCISARKWKLLILAGATGLIWLALHRLVCGSFTWAAREVRYSVTAMDYTTPNFITFLPWAALRSVLILGAPAAAILFCSFRKWKLAVPFSLNFLLLAVSLAMGSLVLPRYIDQLFLLAAPFILIETGRIFTGHRRIIVTAVLILFPSFQWIETIPEIRQYESLRNFYETFELPESGVIAVNELLVPGICISNGIDNPQNRFIAIDRAIFEGASEEDLTQFGVSQVVIIPWGVYYPKRTENWLGSIKNLEVKYFR
jgi:hypothetical protein